MVQYIANMTNLKQRLIDEEAKAIASKEAEGKESDEELKVLGARLKVEQRAFGMEDIKEDLREDFKYSVQALEGMIMMEQNRNAELKKEVDMLKYRKAVIESQFSDDEL